MSQRTRLEPHYSGFRCLAREVQPCVEEGMYVPKGREPPSNEIQTSSRHPAFFISGQARLPNSRPVTQRKTRGVRCSRGKRFVARCLGKFQAPPDAVPCRLRHPRSSGRPESHLFQQAGKTAVAYEKAGGTHPQRQTPNSRHRLDYIPTCALRKSTMDLMSSRLEFATRFSRR